MNDIPFALSVVGRLLLGVPETSDVIVVTLDAVNALADTIALLVFSEDTNCEPLYDALWFFAPRWYRLVISD